MTHEDYMRQALELARACLPDGDVPVGCVVVSPVGEVIGRGRNRREAEGCAAAHAEIEAITQACRRLGSWRLTGCAKIGINELMEAGFISSSQVVKILGNGSLTAKLEVEAHAFSKSAEAAIQAAGGTVVKL